MYTRPYLFQQVADDQEAFVLDELLLDGNGRLKKITDERHQRRAAEWGEGQGDLFNVSKTVSLQNQDIHLDLILHIQLSKSHPCI